MSLQELGALTNFGQRQSGGKRVASPPANNVSPKAGDES